LRCPSEAWALIALPSLSQWYRTAHPVTVAGAAGLNAWSARTIPFSPDCSGTSFSVMILHRRIVKRRATDGENRKDHQMTL